ncbi:hypothetical protein P8935_07445 [Telmatobacter sp. DSM 110680]|uniref:Uncharacterized protein n=1 Tax=Telmatobacter sp. DSM 110680 TaxID=3036704 RepID=A0AAU7DQ09_9BACT
MQTASSFADTQRQSPSATRYRAPIWTLLVLAPVISEVLSGSTRLSILFVLIPEIMVWGGGALLARELVRRWRAGATSLLCLGLALSIAEEFIIQQTSIAPLPFPGANAAYGRDFGVNWIYLLFMLGFESVWVVLVPVQVTELIFPDRGEQPWLRKRGLIATCLAFLVGCRIAWYGWTQQARPRLGAAPYHPPAILILVGITSIVILIGLAWLLRAYGHSGQSNSRDAANPWLIGFKAFIFGAAWFALITLIFVPHSGIALWIPLAAGPLWALLSFALVRYWSGARGWRDMHRFALSFGAVLGCIVPGDVSSAGWTRVDLIGKFVFQFLAVLGFLMLARKVWQQEAANRAHCN